MVTDKSDLLPGEEVVVIQEHSTHLLALIGDERSTKHTATAEALAEQTNWLFVSSLAAKQTDKGRS